MNRNRDENGRRLTIAPLALASVLGVVGATAPGAARAQSAAPAPVKPGSATAVLKRKDVVAAIDRLKLADKLRIDLFRRSGFQDGPACFSPMPISAPDVDFHRTLFVHDVATLTAGNFSLRRTLKKLATDVSASVTVSPEDIFRQLKIGRAHV